MDDNVQKHLHLELDTIKNSQTLIKQTLLSLNEEMRLLQKRKYFLDKDLGDKEIALKVDRATAILKATGVTKGGKMNTRGWQLMLKSHWFVTCYCADAGKRYPLEKTSGGLVSPAQWQEHTEENLQLANIQQKKAIELMSSTDGILAHITSHIRSQRDLTDRALERRIAEVKEAKKFLEEQLAETIVKIGEMEESIVGLEQAITSKRAPLATCQMRLQKRKQRPNIELVMDEADIKLQDEAQGLIDIINRLELQMTKSRKCLASLQKSRLELETQIGIKTNSIYIDEVQCRTVRQKVVIQAY